MTPISDIDLKLEWVYSQEHLKVKAKDGEVVYNSVTQYASPRLTERQVKWITEHYHAKRRKYVFD
jgi:hypothetical protein